MIARKVAWAAALVAIAFIAGCSAGQPPAGDESLTVAALLADPAYDVEVAVQGQVDLLGEMFCPCFELASGGQRVEVWYDLMTDDDGTMWPAVDLDGIANGDTVIVRGELKHAGVFRGEDDFWAIEIERVP